MTKLLLIVLLFTYSFTHVQYAGTIYQIVQGDLGPKVLVRLGEASTASKVYYVWLVPTLIAGALVIFLFYQKTK